MAKQHLTDEPPRSVVRHGKLRRSSTWRNVVRVAFTAVLVVAFSGIATAAYAIWGLYNDTDTVSLGGTKPEAIGAGSQSLDGSLTIFLAGSDTRQGQSFNDGEEGELNDVNLLLHVSADHKNATVISFPRDLMIPIPSCPSEDGQEYYYPAMSEQQLNSTMMYGGLPCTVLTISELTGMDIPYAGVITFDGVIGISNAIGGVEVCLAQPINDPNAGLDLPAGMNTLVGEEALGFLRTRHGVGDGSDVSRISNQQVYMSALLRQLKSADTLSDPLKVYSLAKAAVDNMTLSDGMMSMQFMQAAAGTVKDIDLERINFVQYPTFTHPYESGRLRPDYESAQILFDTILSGQPFDVTGVGEAVVVEGEEGTPADGTEGTEGGTVEGEGAEGEGAEGTGTGDGTTTEGEESSGPVQLPESITGLKPNVESCSAGRTQY